MCLVSTYTFPEEFNEGNLFCDCYDFIGNDHDLFYKKEHCTCYIIVVDQLCILMTQGALWGRVKGICLCQKGHCFCVYFLLC